MPKRIEILTSKPAQVRALLHKLGLEEVWKFVSTLYQVRVFPKACLQLQVDHGSNLPVFSACHFQVNIPWYKIFNSKLYISNELGSWSWCNLGVVQIWFEGFDLGNISNYPQLPSLRDSGPQILTESIVLNTGDKSSNKTWGLPSKSKFFMREIDMGKI